MNFSWFPNILAVVLTSCCYWIVVSSEVTNLTSSASGENSLSISNGLGQLNNLTHRRERRNIRCQVGKPKLHPTIKTFRPFDSHADAESLYKAMKGGGTDEQTIIDILTHRTYEQRNEIAQVFSQTYDYDFRKWIEMEAEDDGVFQVIIHALINHPIQVLADHLLWAVSGSATHEQTLIDILVSMTTTEKKKVKPIFKRQATGDWSLGPFISDDTADEGELQTILYKLAQTNRKEDECFDLVEARKDAATLREYFEYMRKNKDEFERCERCQKWVKAKPLGPQYEDGCKDFCENGYKPRRNSIHHILAKQSYLHLQETFYIYKEEYSVDFDADIYSVWDWHKVTLKAIYQYAMDPNVFFAQALKRDVRKFEGGTSWGYTYGVARVFALRSEIDLGDIAQAFEDEYDMTLSEYVMTYIGGDSKNTLFSILH